MNNSDTASYTETPPANYPLPLQMELEAVQRILQALRVQKQPCLAVGFHAPASCRQLQKYGGYWTSVATCSANQTRRKVEGQDDVAVLGKDAQLPFADKQFDLVVLALGALSGDRQADTALVYECHRVLKVSGYLILTVEYAKPFGLAKLFNHWHPVAHAGGQYSEAALFDLLKTGFDWLGMRTCCRFCVQMVRQWIDRRHPEMRHTPWLTAFYWAARLGDYLIFFTRGYLVTAYGRRKGWRPRATPKLADGRNISETVLIKLGSR